MGNGCFLPGRSGEHSLSYKMDIICILSGALQSIKLYIKWVPLGFSRGSGAHKFYIQWVPVAFLLCYVDHPTSYKLGTGYLFPWALEPTQPHIKCVLVPYSPRLLERTKLYIKWVQFAFPPGLWSQPKLLWNAYRLLFPRGSGAHPTFCRRGIVCSFSGALEHIQSHIKWVQFALSPGLWCTPNLL
jgi:hypothetical protein